MKKSFRNIEKEQLNAQLPIDLAEKIRARSERRGWSLTRTVTEIVSIGMGIDPATYGIETSKESVA